MSKNARGELANRTALGLPLNKEDREDQLGSSMRFEGGMKGGKLRTWAQQYTAPIAVEKTEQNTSYTCGPAALKSALSAFGIDATEDELAERAGTSASGGTSAEGLASAAGEYGLQASIEHGLTIAELLELLDSGAVVVCVVQSFADCEMSDEWDHSHWVVPFSVSNATGDVSIDVMDPSIEGAHASVSASDFDERWHAINMGRRTVGLGLVIRGKEPARKGAMGLPTAPMG